MQKSEGQLLKTFEPNEEGGAPRKTAEVSDVHHSNAYLPMLVTLSGIVTEVSELHL